MEPISLGLDASEQGYGISTSFWPRAEVAKVGRVLERSRFRRVGGHNARDSALTSAGLTKDSLSGRWHSGDLDSADFLKSSGWELDDSFPEVPAEGLRKTLWTPRLWGGWQRKEISCCSKLELW